MTIEELQAFTRQLQKECDWKPKTPIERLAHLTSEVGELAKEVLHWSYARSADKKAEAKQNIGKELYDIVWNICDFANILDIDLDRAFEEKQKVLSARDWAKKEETLYGKGSRRT